MKSVGSVGFNSTSHFEGEEDDTKLAIIDDKLFTDSTDVDVLIEGKKWIDIIALTLSLRELPYCQL